MCKEMIEKHMDGTLSVVNTNFTYNNTEYYGAKFSIVLPL